MTLLFRPYEPGDEAAINAGFDRAFGAQRPLEDWSWKFGRGGSDSWILLAADEAGAVAAQCAAQRIPMQVGERIVQAGHVVDAYCLPSAAREQPTLYRRLVADFYERYGRSEAAAFLYGFPGERTLRLATLRLGFEASVPVPYLWREPTARPSRFRRHSVDTWLEPRSADGLWAACQGRYPAAAVRDGAWLRRRFLSRPGVRYHVLTARRSGRVEAWAVLRLSGDVAHLADLLWDGADPRALRALDEEACRAASISGARGLEMWLGGDSAARDALLDLGWEARPNPLSRALTAVVFDPALRGPDLLGRFYVTMADADLV